MKHAFSAWVKMNGFIEKLIVLSLKWHIVIPYGGRTVGFGTSSNAYIIHICIKQFQIGQKLATYLNVPYYQMIIFFTIPTSDLYADIFQKDFKYTSESSPKFKQYIVKLNL